MYHSFIFDSIRRRFLRFPKSKSQRMENESEWQIPADKLCDINLVSSPSPQFHRRDNERSKFFNMLRAARPMWRQSNVNIQRDAFAQSKRNDGNSNSYLTLANSRTHSLRQSVRCALSLSDTLRLPQRDTSAKRSTNIPQVNRFAIYVQMDETHSCIMWCHDDDERGELVPRADNQMAEVMWDVANLAKWHPIVRHRVVTIALNVWTLLPCGTKVNFKYVISER